MIISPELLGTSATIQYYIDLFLILHYTVDFLLLQVPQSRIFRLELHYTSPDSNFRSHP